MKTIAFAVLLVGCVSAEDETGTTTEDVRSVWTTADSYPGFNGAAAVDVAVGSGRTIIVVGSETLSPDGNGAWMIRSSTDGVTFTEGQAWRLAVDQYAEGEHVAVDAAGTIYMSGIALDANGQWHWITRVGTSISQLPVLDDQIEPVGAGVVTRSIAAYAGYVLVIAEEASSTGTLSYRIRYTRNGGRNWRDLPLPANVTLTGLCSTSAGFVGIGSVAGQWATWINPDPAAAPWTMIDHVGATYSPSTCAEVDGQIYVGGVFSDGNPADQAWVLRSRPSSGGSFGFVDSYHTPFGGSSAPLAIGGGSGGHVYVTGRVAHSSTWPYATSWHTRVRNVGTWSDSDDVLGTNESAASGIAFAPGLGTFVVGFVDGDAVVRRTP